MKPMKPIIRLLLTATLLWGLLAIPAAASELNFAAHYRRASHTSIAGDNACEPVYNPVWADHGLLPALEGKSILFFGDSLTSGHGLDGYDQSWCGMLSTRYGMKVTSASISGSTIGVSPSYGYFPGGCYSPICQREIPSGSFDIIFVQGSGNDWYCEIPLGTDPAARDTGTLMGALNVTFDRLQAQYPDALMVYMTPWNTTGETNALGYNTYDYCAASMQVCETRGIPCFEACDPTISGIYASSAPFREAWFLTPEDYWHLNPAGQERFLPVIAKWLNQVTEAHFHVRGFTDVLNRDWFADAVAFVYDRGYMLGTGGQTFSPNLEMNRAMLVTVLYRLAGTPQVSSSTPFLDVPENQYYTDAVAWAYETGVTKGVSDTAFAPEALLTREELVTFLYRYFEGAAPAESDPLGAFTDGNTVSDFASDPMAWAISQDIVHGIGNNTLAPAAIANRAQVATMLMNHLNQPS